MEMQLLSPHRAEPVLGMNGTFSLGHAARLAAGAGKTHRLPFGDIFFFSSSFPLRLDGFGDRGVFTGRRRG